MHLKQTVLTIAIAIMLVGVAQGEELNPVLGRAGEYIIREADFERILSKQPQEVKAQVSGQSPQREEFIRQLLLSRVIAAKARKEGLDRKPEVKEQLSQVMDQFLAQEYLLAQTASVKLTEEEVKAYYLEHLAEFQIPETAKVRHIYFEVAADATPEVKAKTKERADKVMKALKGGEDFAALAREHSDDKDTADKGGDIGYVRPGKTNSPELEKAIFALKQGEMSDPVNTAFGYHILKVDERKEKRTGTLDEAREFITQRLKAQAEQKIAREVIDKIAKESNLEVVGAAPASDKVAAPQQKPAP